MARWQLTEPHYLNVPGTYWEQVLTDRVTQRPIRKQFPVPLHLDPRIESDWTERDRNAMDGRIIVCYAGKGEPKDIIFVGDPTPGMLPLDEEAKEISSRFNWTPTVDMTPEAQEASNQSKILNGLIKQLAEATVSGPTAAAPAGFEKFMESMGAMMQQQTMLLASIMERQQLGEFAAQARRVGAEPAEEAEALPEAEAPTLDELAKAAEEAQAREMASQARAQNVAEAASKPRRRA